MWRLSDVGKSAQWNGASRVTKCRRERTRIEYRQLQEAGSVDTRLAA